MLTLDECHREIRRIVATYGVRVAGPTPIVYAFDDFARADRHRGRLHLGTCEDDPGKTVMSFRDPWTRDLATLRDTAWHELVHAGLRPLREALPELANHPELEEPIAERLGLLLSAFDSVSVEARELRRALVSRRDTASHVSPG